MQTLAVVLNEHFPIGLCLVNGCQHGLERAHLKLFQVARPAVQRLQPFNKRKCLLIEVDKQVALPLVHSNLLQRDAFAIERLLVVMDCAHQVAVEGICPGVVWACNCAAVARTAFVAQLRTAVLAHVVISAQFTFLVAHNKNALVADLCNKSVANVRQLITLSNVAPIGRKHFAHFFFVYG